MDPEDTAHEFDTADEFWDELDRVLAEQCDSSDLIDDALRSYLALISGSRGGFTLFTTKRNKPRKQ